MDKTRKEKLLELRQKKNESKKQEESQKHSELIQAVNSLHALFNEQNAQNAKNTEALLVELSKSNDLKEEVAKVKQAIKDLPKVDEVSITNLSELIESQKDLDMTEVVKAVNELAQKVENKVSDEVKITNKEVEDFIPVRRVRKNKLGKLEYDDDPLQVSVVGGGGSITPRIKSVDGHSAVPVANPDGTLIGSGSGGDASAANQDEQTLILQQIADNTDTLELKAENINLNTDGLESKADAANILLQDIKNNTATAGGAEPQGARDIFARQKISMDSNQVEIPYDDTTWATFVDQTSSGSAPAAAQANGQVTISSGTGTNGTRVIISKDTVKYRLGQEVGWGGTWSFDASGVANADVFWGAFDDVSLTNAVLFGHFGTTFGIRYRRGGTTVWTKDQTQWLDKCDGSVGSAYTRNGVPEAMDKTKDQIARIRAGLFGHRGFQVEIINPDGEWILILDHTNVNTETVAVFTNNDLKIGMGVVKTGAGATNLSVTSACQSGWTASDKTRINDVRTDRTIASNVVAALMGRTNAGVWVGVNVNSQGRLFVTNDSVGVNGAAIPTSSGLAGVKDGSGNLQPLVQPTTPTDTQPVSGTVALDAPTLAALENITVAVSSGTITLDSATLAALENIVVSGTVALDSATLTALENINAVVSGTVELGATTLAALENITATVSGSVTVSGTVTSDKGTGWVDPQTDALTDTQLRATPVNTADPTKQNAIPYAQVLSASTTITPTSGKRIQVLRSQILQNPTNTGATLVTLGFTSIGNFLKAWVGADSTEWIGAINEPLNITVTGTEQVSVNIRYKEIA